MHTASLRIKNVHFSKIDRNITTFFTYCSQLPSSCQMDSILKLFFFFIVTSCKNHHRNFKSVVFHSGPEMALIAIYHVHRFCRHLRSKTHAERYCSLEGNQNKYNCLVSNFYNKLKSRALFSHLFRTDKSAGKINLL